MQLDRLSEKRLLEVWEDYLNNMRKYTAVVKGESEAEQKKRIKHLEANPEEWFKYYFPKECRCEPATFHKQSTKRVLKNMEWMEVRMWSRELSKSTRTMMEMMYLVLTGKKHNLLLISNSLDNATRLLMPYRAHLQANERIIHDYGLQELPGKWTAEEFSTRKNVSFRALGWGQSPRGSKTEDAIRPDIILFDDIDTDEECRNPDTIKKKWDWIEDAAIKTRSIDLPTTIIFCGNKIAEDCTVERATKIADKTTIINIRNEYGKSTWPQKNSEAHIDRVISKSTYASAQKEYFNNPLTEGAIFKHITWGKVPPLSSFPFLVAYADPSTSNKDKQTARKSQNSYKSLVLLGCLDMKFYLITCYLDHVNNSQFVDWFYGIKNYVHNASTQLYYFIENNTLQDPFYEQVFLPLFYDKGREMGDMIPITPDARNKPEKFFRIEGTLEPLNRLGQLIFNEKEKENPHMKLMEAQFKSVSPAAKIMDGPDAVEGGVWIIKNKLAINIPGAVKTVRRKTSTKRF